jgi:hypothetical protein
VIRRSALALPLALLAFALATQADSQLTLHFALKTEASAQIEGRSIHAVLADLHPALVLGLLGLLLLPALALVRDLALLALRCRLRRARRGFAFLWEPNLYTLVEVDQFVFVRRHQPVAAGEEDVLAAFVDRQEVRVGAFAPGRDQRHEGQQQSDRKRGGSK